MANDNPFDPKYPYGLLGLLAAPPPEKPTNALTSPASDTTPGFSDLLGALSPPAPLANPYSTSISNLLGSEKPPPAANPNGLGLLAGLFSPTPPAPLGLGVLSGHFPSTDPPAPPAPLGLGALSGLFPSTDPPKGVG